MKRIVICFLGICLLFAFGSVASAELILDQIESLLPEQQQKLSFRKEYAGADTLTILSENLDYVSSYAFEYETEKVIYQVTIMLPEAADAEEDQILSLCNQTNKMISDSLIPSVVLHYDYPDSEKEEPLFIASAAMEFNEDKSPRDVAQFVEDMNYITQMLMASVACLIPTPTSAPRAMPTAAPTATPVPEYTTKDLGNGTCEITKYNGTATELTIPSRIDGKQVVRIAEWAFCRCNRLTNVIIPDGVTSIGVEAFWGCSSLGNVTIPDGVTSIGDRAFSYCYRLKNVAIPDGVTSIGNGAFMGCSSLADVTLPDSVTSIGDYAFEDCSSLIDVTIPDGVTSIRDYAFSRCTGLKHIYGKTGSRAERLAADLGVEFVSTGYAAGYEPTATTAPATDYEIKDTGNGTCEITKYTGTAAELTIPSEIGGKRVVSIGKNTFRKNDGLKSVIIPEGVTNIGESAFELCDALMNVAIPESVTSIRDFAFYYCTSLTDVTIPKNMTSIGNWAFYFCTSLTNVSIPEGVRNIGESAFRNCTSLTNVTIPEAVTNIAYGAFQDCTGLTNVTLPNGLTKIERYAFSGCSSLANVTIPEGVTSIGNSAFSYCTRLKSVSIPESVTSFGFGSREYSVFDNCKNLEKIYGKTGSAAERLATEIGVEFVSTGYVASYEPTEAPKSIALPASKFAPTYTPIPMTGNGNVPLDMRYSAQTSVEYRVEYNDNVMDISADTETATERFINIAQQDIGKRGATYGFTDEWCAMVVKRWADQAGLGNAVPSQANTAAMAQWFNENGNRFALTRRDESGEINCWSYGTWSTNLPTADYFFEPQPGDIVFFETNNNPSDGIDHVGVCVNVSGATVDVVEGNTGSKSNSESIVSKNSYNWRANNSKIWGFARPASSDNVSEPIATSTPSPEVVLPQPTAKDLYSEVREIPKNNMDAILMMDTSGSMSSVSAHTGKPILSYAKEAALAFVNQAFAYNENYRVGLATFDSNARLLQPMVEKQNDQILRDSISDMRANGQTNIAEGFDCASEILDDDGRSDARQVIVLFTDGIHNCSGDPVFSGQQAMNGQSGKPRDIYTVGLVGALSEEEKKKVRSILDQPYAVRYIEIDEEEQIEGAFYLLGLAASSGNTEERIHTLRVRGAASVEVINVDTGETLSATQSSEMPFGSVYLTKDNYEAIYALDKGDYTLRVCGGDVRTIGIVMETMDGRAVAVSEGANLRFNGNAGTRLEATFSFGDNTFDLNDLSFDPYTYKGLDPFTGEYYQPQYELNVPAGIANLPNGGLVSQRSNGYSASVPNEANMPDRVHEQHLEIFNPFFESEGYIVESRTSYNMNYDHYTYFFGGSDMKLYRIAENGGEKEKVIDKKLVAYWVDETGIYYSDGSSIIRRQRGESSGKAIVRQGVATGSNLSRMIRFGEYLYYISAKDRCIYAVPYAGGEPRRITNEAARCLTFAQQGNDVILIYNTYHKQREFEYLRAIDLNGNPIAGLESLNKINSHYFNYAHGYLYYCDKDNGCALYRINLNNPAENKRLASICASRIFLFDDYVVTTDDSKYFCVMRPDGSEFKTIYAPYIRDR